MKIYNGPLKVKSIYPLTQLALRVLKNEQRSLAFLNTWSIINNDGPIRTKVFRKKAHTDQYLNFNSNHPLEHNRGVARTLLHRATMVLSDPVELQKEKDHIRNALHLNGYPDWVIDQCDYSTPTNTPLDNTSIIHENEDNDHISLHPSQTVSHKKMEFTVVIPYIKGVSKELRRLFKRYEVPMYFKPTNTLRQLLVRLKDKLKKERVVGRVYQISCKKCLATYIGETERSLKQHFLEHRRPSSVTLEVSRHVHLDHPDHSISMDDTNILEVASKWFEHGVKEVIHIRVTHPSLNKDGGRCNLPSVWTNILNERTRGPGLRISNSKQSLQDDTNAI